MSDFGNRLGYSDDQLDEKWEVAMIDSHGLDRRNVDGGPEDREARGYSTFESLIRQVDRLMKRVVVLESAVEQLQDVSIDDLQTQLDRLNRGLDASGVI